MESVSEEKKQKRNQILIAIGKSIGIGFLQGAISSGMGVLLNLINIWSVFGILAIWLIFGWFSSYIIRVNTLEIIVTVISGSLISLLIFWIANFEIWFIPIIIGLSLLFWIISFISKVFLFPPSYLKKSEKDEKN